MAVDPQDTVRDPDGLASDSSHALDHQVTAHGTADHHDVAPGGVTGVRTELLDQDLIARAVGGLHGVGGDAHRLRDEPQAEQHEADDADRDQDRAQRDLGAAGFRADRGFHAHPSTPTALAAAAAARPSAISALVVILRGRLGRIATSITISASSVSRQVMSRIPTGSMLDRGKTGTPFPVAPAT